jgi:N-methylhydantoinase A
VLINAYLAPKMQGYVDRLNEALEGRSSQLDVMQSSGGIISALTASREPVRTVLSGPAGGVVGALALAKIAGFPRILTFDMGGTSTDVALVDSELGLRTTSESRVLGMPVAVPMLNIHTVGAGGGSLASFDRGGALKVGPESAGADPGPVCYGRGEQPTVTDANLLLGRFAQTGLLGGGMLLDEERARGVFESAKGQLGTVEQFAEGITRVVNAHMEKALRKISVEYGYDPRDFVLFSFGGAGPLHACALAKALNIPTVLVPRMPGALSAYGVFVSDAVRDYSRTVMLPPADPQLEKHFESLEQLSRAENGHGDSTEYFRSVDLRYRGQGYEISVDWDGDPTESFHREHERRYGYADRKRRVEAVTVRLRSVLSSEVPALRQHKEERNNDRQAVITEKKIYTDGHWVPGLVYNREGLQAGDVFAGPAIVTEYSATTFVPPGCRVEVDGLLNMVIDVCAD